VRSWRGRGRSPQMPRKWAWSGSATGCAQLCSACAQRVCTRGLAILSRRSPTHHACH